MTQGQDLLNYQRLINREAFYKNKALKLEKEVIFAQEKISALETELENAESRAVQQDEADTDEETVKALQLKYDELQAAYNQLEKAYEDVKRKPSHENETNAQEKLPSQDLIAQYEQLLEDVETEINEKENQINIYKTRIERLEKQLNRGYPSEMGEALLDDEQKAVSSEKAIAYMDYALIIEKNQSIVRLDFSIQNIGDIKLIDPLVCFRFYPADIAKIKGKSITKETWDFDLSRGQWEIVEDGEWSDAAKERGEIWLRPLRSIQVLPGEKTVLHDLQIPIQMKIVDHVTIEAFVYFPSLDERIKGLNQIVINV